MNTLLRKSGYAVGIGLVAVSALTILRGPQGLSMLRQKQDDIRVLQVQNADLANEIKAKRERIERLRTSQAERELEIRNRLKLLRPGETSFILPDEPKPAAH